MIASHAVSTEVVALLESPHAQQVRASPELPGAVPHPVAATHVTCLFISKVTGTHNTGTYNKLSRIFLLKEEGPILIGIWIKNQDIIDLALEVISQRVLP